MTEKKRCPMRFRCQGECIEEECAWWIKGRGFNRCAVADAAISLDCIREGVGV